MSDLTKLGEPFPPEMLRSRNKGGTTLSYIPISEVIARLNAVLGIDGWGYEIGDRWTSGEKQTDSGVYPVWCMAQVRMTVHGDGVLTNHEAIGGQEVKFLKEVNGVTPGPVDMGDEWKGAVSDALKKAAQAFGVGLELARKEEAIAHEHAGRLWPDLGWADEAEYAEVWGGLKLLAGDLDEDGQAQVREWWHERQPKAPHSRRFLEEYAEVIDRLTPAEGSSGGTPRNGAEADAPGHVPSDVTATGAK